jgi:hypothetical protein
MGPRWVSLTYASLHNLFDVNLSGTEYLVSTFVKFFLSLLFFLHSRYRVAEVQWLQDIPVPEGSQERKDVSLPTFAGFYLFRLQKRLL